MKNYKIALAGNPNVGKSTLFNALTGSRQHTGNWPGKTVEKTEGSFAYQGKKFDIVDLPGTYSLSAYSIEELIARDYIVDEQPDAVVHVVDSTNLERNLYLTMQLIELDRPMVLALNMEDEAFKKGIKIDEKKLAYFLKIPVVTINAKQKQGLDALQDVIHKEISKKTHEKISLNYGEELNKTLEEIIQSIQKLNISQKYNERFLAIKLLEKDNEIIQNIRDIKNIKQLIEFAKEKRLHLEHIFGEDIDTILADARYGFIAGMVKEGVKEEKLNKLTLSEKIDKVVTNRFLGIPIFLLIMYLMFEITFTVADPLVGIIDDFFGSLSEWSLNFLTSINVPEWVGSLVSDGIIAGIGSILVFIPNIFLLFAFISILEDSGYMARAAFIADKFMHKLGLHGKSFIPFIIGFGCNVPAIMATRTLENKKDRLLTILINPFMSCSARLPIYVLFVSAFFPAHQGLVIFSLYFLGIIIAIIVGIIFKNTIFKGLSAPFVMELPPYRIPTIFGTLLHIWQRGKLFIKKAGTIIFAVVVCIWFLGSIPFGVEYGSADSVIGMIGSFIAPIFKPLGFGDWQSAVALIFGFAAKEVVVGTLATLHSVSEEGLIMVLQKNFTPLSAYSFMVFSLLYVPCMAVMAVIKRETNSWGWTLFAAIYTTIVAWVAAFLVYQIGSYII